MRVGLALLACLAGPHGAAEAGERVTLVELFTSQGCSSCPPADAFLGELAGRSDVLPVSMHVAYWDYGGWKDPFALPELAARQQAYREHFGLPYVYTPDLVIGGAVDLPGTSRDEALATLAEHTGRAPVVPVAVDRAADGRGVVEVGAGAGTGTVWLVVFDHRHETLIGHGENDGRMLVNHNVVRRLLPLGPWPGLPVAFAIAADAMPAPDRQGAAVFVQANPIGPILGAARLR